MVHETPDPYRFLREMKDMLRNDGRFLIVEPKMHMSQQMFDQKGLAEKSILTNRKPFKSKPK
jgi:hypothetical protein